MHLFNIVTVFVIFVLIGVEFCVSAFINPVMRKLDVEPQAKALSIFARMLGGVMPFWYGAGLLLLAVQAWLHRGTAAYPLLLTAAVLWLGVIVFTLVVLVPINNRIAARSAADWQQQHRRWDNLHRLRVLVLAVAGFCLLWRI
ncbi:DUF1772 domain-containing protein [Edaphobacter paludis]|uniref:DUF1772 domain-containing protein n=1 Tax=Edaphobacter paludis TaxID=3035702 RepID=A0AAU7D4T6_9BACT